VFSFKLTAILPEIDLRNRIILILFIKEGENTRSINLENPLNYGDNGNSL
jgi:hypothetical protein